MRPVTTNTKPPEQLPPITTPPATATATYTTIPLSTTAVIHRSFQNFSSYTSLLRPWPEFLPSTTFSQLPSSPSSAISNLRKNASYFKLNYITLVIFSCAFLFLVSSPVSFLVFGLLLALWLVFYFFREDTLIVFGEWPLSNNAVLVGLIFVSVVGIWLMGMFQNLILGSLMGGAVCCVHGVLRSTDGLFLDEEAAVSCGLIGSGTSDQERR